ncbi:hypothetical protein BC829DRAFT_439110 [Chytridium lagenaria]|nr:hypothetical protein BC829DRAFT_439110 [Chytridium lagenaria]
MSNITCTPTLILDPTLLIPKFNCYHGCCVPCPVADWAYGMNVEVFYWIQRGGFFGGFLDELFFKVFFVSGGDGGLGIGGKSGDVMRKAASWRFCATSVIIHHLIPSNRKQFLGPSLLVNNMGLAIMSCSMFFTIPRNGVQCGRDRVTRGRLGIMDGAFCRGVVLGGLNVSMAFATGITVPVIIGKSGTALPMGFCSVDLEASQYILIPQASLAGLCFVAHCITAGPMLLTFAYLISWTCIFLVHKLLLDIDKTLRTTHPFFQSWVSCLTTTPPPNVSPSSNPT